MRQLESLLREKGVSTDAREPDIVRASPRAALETLHLVLRLQPTCNPTRMAPLAPLTHQVRISPAPLFNSFDDVRRFIAALTACLTELA
jgi:kynureninase